MNGETEDCFQSKLDAYFNPLGFECHPFLTSWYNDKVNQKFRLEFADDALGYVIISQPSMFEKTFLPFLRHKCHENQSEFIGDPIDHCMRSVFKESVEHFPNEECKIFHDFELLPNRRPKVLVQTAAHVAGAVKYFQESDVKEKELLSDMKSSKIYPVCLHPRWGGWFAIRGVIIFQNVRRPHLQKLDCQLELGQSEIALLLKRYNDCWQDWTFRDVYPSEDKYSEKQRLYFSTNPSERMSLVKDWSELK